MKITWNVWKLWITIWKNENNFIKKIEIVENLFKDNFEIVETKKDFIIITWSKRYVLPLRIKQFILLLKYKNVWWN
jgi:hypothetical protein